MCITPRYSLALILSAAAIAQAGPQLPPLDDGRGKPAATATSPASPTNPKTGATGIVGHGRARPMQPANKSGKPAMNVTAAPAAPPVPVRPPRPSELPTVTPRVSFDNGQLTIVAANSSMADIISGIRSATGIKIETVGGPNGDRVAAKIGPAPVRSVLLSLLQGSRYDYVMLGSVTDPETIERVILSPRTTGTQTTAAAPASPPAPAEEPAEEVQEEEGGEVAPAPQPAPVPGAPSGNEAPPTDTYDQQQMQQQRGEPTTTPKTPEQLLEDLKRLEQERQQQRQDLPIQRQEPQPQPEPQPDRPR